MRDYHLLTMFLLFFISSPSFSISIEAKEKYGFLLLTDDYSILNDSDLIELTKIIIYPASKKRFSSGIYWQCFPNKNVSFIIEDFGYTSEDLEWKENFSLLVLSIKTNNNITEEYILRRPLGISENKKTLRRWRKIMKNEKYFCISGTALTQKEKIENGKKTIIHPWIFEKLKTKKGCNSYF